MESLLAQISQHLGDGWHMYWGHPPSGVFVLKDVYMSDPQEVSQMCREGAVVVYITAMVGDTYVIHGRVKPGVINCPVVTFVKKYKRRDARDAVGRLIEFVLKVEKLPPFQINPEVLRFADLCWDYPYLCEEPTEVVKALEEKVDKNKHRARETSKELEDLIRALVASDSRMLNLLKQVLENPEKLVECYVR